MTVPTTAPATPPPTLIVENWQFGASTTAPGTPPVSIGGSILQDGTVASGVLHFNGSKCVDPLIAMKLTGNVNAGVASLTATGIDGSAVSLAGTFSITPGIYGPNAGSFAGIYSVKGGCVAVEQGDITGNDIPYIANLLDGTFTDSAQKAFHATGDIAQSGSASSEGSFEISGKATFDTPCLSAATIKPGTFPSGSFILGRSVGLEFDTENGTLTFLGTLSPDRAKIDGNYTISGATCNGTGTAALTVTSPRDY